jgi:mannonate dehydratase
LTRCACKTASIWRAGVLKSIEHFGRAGRIFCVHFRDVQGGCDDFTECHIDAGNTDTAAIMRKLRDVGFNGFLIDDHVPHMVNDSSYGHRGRAFATGYMIGMMNSL